MGDGREREKHPSYCSCPTCAAWKLVKELEATLATRDAALVEARDLLRRYKNGNYERRRTLIEATRTWLAAHPVAGKPEKEPD